jgi:hypothetical protein
MIAKLSAIWRVFRKGEEVANPAAWKAGQVTATAIGGFLIAAVQAASAFGFEVPADEGQISAIAAGVLAVGNILLTLATSRKVGLPAVGETAPGTEGEQF